MEIPPYAGNESCNIVFWLFQHFSHGETKIIMMWMPDGDVDDVDVDVDVDVDGDGDGDVDVDDVFNLRGR